ncbi:hypothetical protein PUZ01_002298 [Enterobacter cloacae]|nr:hypothetical protein [Enterobacter cloacae]EKV5785053.1 hypothetical protein [Enterobacter cloacae]
MLDNIFFKALETFFAKERTNISIGISERNLCARLARYIESEVDKNELVGYYADVEYNRKQNGEVKTIIDGDLKVIRISCDLILHSRGENIGRDNLIAIEMKKNERPDIEKTNDINRLRALTKKNYDDVWSFDGKTHPEHVCGYEKGYFIEIDNKEFSYNIISISDGEIVNSKNERF